MSNEIDLQQFAKALLKRWWVILIFVVLGVVLALALAAGQSKYYQASSTLLAQDPRYQWQFDNTITPILDLSRDMQRELLAIGRNQRVAEQAAEVLRTSGQVADVSTGEILSQVNLRGGDGNTIIVTTRSPNPQQAAAIANAYTDSLISLARQVYGVSQEVDKYQAELETATERMAVLDDQYEAVRTRTGLYTGSETADLALPYSPKQQELLIKGERLAQYRNTLDTIRYLKTQISKAEPGADLGLLPWELLDDPLLQSRAILTPAIAQANSENKGTLLDLLQREEQVFTATVDQLAGETEQVQATLAADWREYGEISRERNLARELYFLLRRNINEASVQQRADPGVLVLIDPAVPPAEPVRTRQLAQVLTAAAVGLIIGVLVALWLEFRQGRKTPESVESQHSATTD